MPTSTAAAATGETSVTLSTEALEAGLLHHLASTSALDDLHSNLLASLQRAGWTERVRNTSLELLRAGRCERFDDVLDTVVALAEGRSHSAVTRNNNGTKALNNNRNNYNHNRIQDPDTDTYFENIDLRVPQAVVEQGVKAIREALREVVDDDGDLMPDGDGEPKQAPASTKKKVKDSGDGASTTTTAHIKQEKGKAMTKDFASSGHSAKNMASIKDAAAAAKPSQKSGDAATAKKPTKDRKPRPSGKDSQVRSAVNPVDPKSGSKS